MNAVMALIVVACAQETAEATFKKIEAAYAKAKTVKVTFKGSATMTQGEKTVTTLECSGTLLLKGDNKVKCTTSTKSDKNREKATFSLFACDGTTMAPLHGETQEAPGGLRAGATATLFRLGGQFAMERMSAAYYSKGKDKTPWDGTLSNFAAGEKDGELATLTYDLVADGSTHKVKLSYDASTMKVGKISVTLTPTDKTSQGKAGKGIVIVETMTCEFDGEIADEEFAPPKGK